MAGSPANVRSMRSIGQLCEDAGLRVVEAAGWGDRGRSWGVLRPERVVVHHTAMAQDVDRVLIDGRPDLPGPLCNFSLHADGTVVLIASGTANHAGVATISSAAAYGIEATGPVPAGATGPPAFPQFAEYVTLCAAVCLHHSWPTSRVVAHKEIARPDGRKPDPAFGSRFPSPYADMSRFRAQVADRIRTWGAEEDDTMTPEDWARLETLVEAKVREGVRLVDHGDEDVKGASNNLAVLREEDRVRWDALGKRLDAIEDMLTNPLGP